MIVSSGDSGLHIFSCVWVIFLEEKFPYGPCWPNFSNSRDHLSNISYTIPQRRRYKGPSLEATPRRKTRRRYRIYTGNQKKCPVLKAQTHLWKAQVVTTAKKSLWRFLNTSRKWVEPNHTKPSSHLQKELVHPYPGRPTVGPKWLCRCSLLWLRDMKSQSMACACSLENSGNNKTKTDF